MAEAAALRVGALQETVARGAWEDWSLVSVVGLGSRCLRFVLYRMWRFTAATGERGCHLGVLIEMRKAESLVQGFEPTI